jgi:predicted O-linked N-acetylglucosamine transferase (SPINDLY family)
MLLRPMQNHDREQVEVICYADYDKPDWMTPKFKACADEWYETRALSHEALAEKIRTDHIDILVDLTLHLSGSRLLAFARRPAPVQLSHMGYPATTGTRCIQYRITDHHLDPVGKRKRSTPRSSSDSSTASGASCRMRIPRRARRRR